MGALHQVTVAAASFLALVVVMVLIHEMGHLLAAKAFGVRVKSFSVGIGPRLFGFHVGETDYKLCLFPIGGYVKMNGAQPSESGGKNPHPRWQRMMICFAGPAANLALAFFLMAVYYAAFNETPRLNLSTPTVDWAVPGSDAARAGIRAGDVIQSFASVRNQDWDHLHILAEAHSGQIVPMTVMRGGDPVRLNVRMPSAAKFGVEAIGLLPNLTGAPIAVASVTPGSPAEVAGIRKGDQIVSVDELKVHFIDTLTTYIDRSSKPATIGLLRNGRMQSVLVDPHFTRGAWRIGIRSAGFPVKDSPLPLGPAISKAALYCVSGTGVIVETVKNLITHRGSDAQVSGPIGVARIAGNAAESKYWMPKFSLTAIVSLNLALFNLLPLPILDGGIIAMLLFEGVRRKDISVIAKARLRTFALAAVAVLFVAALASDVSKSSFFVSAAKHHKIVFWSLSAPVLAGFSYRARFAPWCRGITSSITSHIFVWRKVRISGNRHRAIAVTTDAHS